MWYMKMLLTEPKDLIITAVGTKATVVVYFRITGCHVQVFSNLGEIIYELKLNRLAVQLNICC